MEIVQESLNKHELIRGINILLLNLIFFLLLTKLYTKNTKFN